jgi:hypothetical protein
VASGFPTGKPHIPGCGPTWGLISGKARCLRGPRPTDTLTVKVRSFSPSRAAVVRTGVVFVAIATFTGPVYAQTSTPSPTAGEVALQRARQAWEAGDFDLVPGLCQRALEAGGLKRDDVVEVYVRMGSALAVGKKKHQALAALRQAALLEPTFSVPAEAGKRAVAMAEEARKEQRRVGSLTVSAQAPEEVPPGAAVPVDVALSPIRSTPVDSVAFIVRDPLTGHSFQQDSPVDAHLHFEVPLRLTLPEASLLVTVLAHDAHANELASTERHVRVGKAPVVVTPSPALAALGPVHAPRKKESPPAKPSGGFWDTAWPYIIGGTALLAGGIALSFATRPSDDVNVGAARLELVH